MNLQLAQKTLGSVGLLLILILQLAYTACSPNDVPGRDQNANTGMSTYKQIWTSEREFAQTSYLYLLATSCEASRNGCVRQYLVGHYKIPVRKITSGIGKPTGMAFDSFGNLYVSNFDSNVVTVYEPGKLTPNRYLSGPGSPVALTFDHSDNLFVANVKCRPAQQPCIAVYASGASEPKRTITGIEAPHALATDSAGNLYVAGSKIWIYAPGSSSPLHVITRGIDVPLAMAFDRDGNLTVANSASGKYPRKTGSVTVYSANKYSLIRTIKNGLVDPIALAFSGSYNLFVLSSCLVPYSKNCEKFWVSVYAPGKTSPMRMIRNGIQSPATIAIDRNGYAFVGNCASCSRGDTTVYAPGKGLPSQTIRAGSKSAGPIAIGFAKK